MRSRTTTRRAGATRGWHRSLVVAGVVALLAAACAGGEGGRSTPTAEPTPDVELAACTVGGRAARCGTLSVPEDRLTRTGRLIDVGVVVLPATGDRPADDPVVYFAGGPGGAASDDVGDIADVLWAVNVDRDLVFVDQRGTGRSNELVCPPPAAGVDLDQDASALTSYVGRCLAGIDADPAFYTTAMYVDDVADVLAALEYDQVNLYGGSYGATAAQVFLRRHDDLVRTMTLSGGTLLDLPIFELMAQNSADALEAVFARCAADATCSTAFPRVRAEWQQLLDDVTAAPVVLPADRSPTGKSFALTADVLAGEVHDLLLSAETAAQLPLLIHTFATAGDRAALLEEFADRRASELTGAERDEFLVMRYVIRCSEPWARFDPDEVSRRAADSYYGHVMLTASRWWQRACGLFPRADTAADYGEARVTDVPVLSLNGDADPQDPPANMGDAGSIWPNGRQLVEPGQAHGISAWPCRASVIAAFIERGAGDGLDATCLDTVPVPRFSTVIGG